MNCSQMLAFLFKFICGFIFTSKATQKYIKLTEIAEKERGQTKAVLPSNAV